jgi:hypothetical protein
MGLSARIEHRTVRQGWAALARPALRSGLHVVRRDDGHLQIGLDEPDRLVLRDQPGLHEALTRLERPPSDGVRDIVDRLVADGWVVDLAVEAQRRRDAVARRPPVSLSVDPLLEEALVRACRTASVQVSSEAAVRLVVTLGEPSRTVSDSLMREDVPHLWVAVLPRRVRLGPFVEPGRSACLRCVDAHLGERDPRRATVLHQLDDRPSSPTATAEPGLVALASAYAVRDVCRRLDGEVPALRSADVTVTDDLELIRRSWLRHPHCGCAWG